jgi:hypothetical protein
MLAYCCNRVAPRRLPYVLRVKDNERGLNTMRGSRRRVKRISRACLSSSESSPGLNLSSNTFCDVAYLQASQGESSYEEVSDTKRTFP